MPISIGLAFRKLLTLKGDIKHVTWSTGNGHLRFDISESVGGLGQQLDWEVAVVGTGLHRLLAGWHNPPDECCGKRPFGWLNWSKDGQYVYVLDYRGKGAALRIRISDRNTEQVVDLKNFITTGGYGGWLALAPDDSPLLLRYTGTQDIYALDWEAP
jgi:hypothetical protein